MDAYGPDRYKRVLAVVWDEQINVNLLMVAMGYAEVYRGAPCQAYCQELEQAEAKARQDRVGMWAQGAGYESPALFRRRMRIRRRIRMAKATRQSPRRRSLLESRLAYHLRCLREDATDPDDDYSERAWLWCETGQCELGKYGRHLEKRYRTPFEG